MLIKNFKLKAYKTIGLNRIQLSIYFDTYIHMYILKWKRKFAFVWLSYGFIFYIFYLFIFFCGIGPKGIAGFW